MKKLILSFLCLTGCLLSQAQIRNNEVYEVTEMNLNRQRTEIRIPGFNGYQTLKCEFHIHTVFSDGLVWPSIRVSEAWQQGLDAIAITDHIEYRPNKEILQGDLNESFKIARKAGEQIGFIVIQGTEITRKKPFGHMNALFIQDATLLDTPEPLDAIAAAKKQGAFIMWNHPGWPDDKSTLYPIHEEMIRNNDIHGVEVFNHVEYYPVSFGWCKEKGLAYMANSDMHSLITQEYGTAIRPMTLVFAKEKSEQAIKEALFARRTAAYFNGELAGPSEYLQPLVLASLTVRKINDKTFEVTNSSDIPYRMTAQGSLFIFPAGKTTLVTIPEKPGVFTVENCHVGSSEKLMLPIDTFFNR